ncbi:MAG TPA: hypothetical protein VGG45_04715 [Terracidiphilus sp.]|jgi:hypothetical protein
MTSRRDTVTARLRKKYEEWDSYDFQCRRKANVDLDGKRDLSDEAVWAETAREAFGFNGSQEEAESDVFGFREEDRFLMEVFWTFNLDPADPRDVRALLHILSDVLGPELTALVAKYKRAGAPRKWTPVLRRQLLAAADKIKREAGRKMTDLEACERLKKAAHNLPHIKHTSAGALVRQLVEGRRLLRRARRTGETPAPLGLWRRITSS